MLLLSNLKRLPWQSLEILEEEDTHSVYQLEFIALSPTPFLMIKCLGFLNYVNVIVMVTLELGSLVFLNALLSCWPILHRLRDPADGRKGPKKGNVKEHSP